MPRCTAKSSRTGKRCKKSAVTGATVCRSHGAGAPQVRAAAKVRAAEMEARAEAERMVARAGVDADPIEHLLESLHRAAALVEVWGQMVALIDEEAEKDAERTGEIRGALGYDLNTDEKDRDELVVHSRDRLLALNSRGEAQVHPYVREYQTALERRAKFAKLCIDAGIAERQVQIAEAQGRMLAAVVTAILVDLDLKPDSPKVRKVVGRHLRAIEGGKAA